MGRKRIVSEYVKAFLNKTKDFFSEPYSCFTRSEEHYLNQSADITELESRMRKILTEKYY